MTNYRKLIADVVHIRIETLAYPTITYVMSRYKDYSEQLNNMNKLVLSEDLSNEGREMVVERLDLVKRQNLSTRSSARQGIVETGGQRDKLAAASRQAMEEKNKFALFLLSRVRVKLEVREPHKE